VAAKTNKLAGLLAKLKAGKKLTKSEEAFVEASKQEGRYVKSLSAVAAQFGVIRQNLVNWKKYDTDGALEKTELGYDIEAVKRLRARMLVESGNPILRDSDIGATKPAADGEAEEELDVGTLKARKIRLECDKLIVQIQRELKKLVLLDDVLAEGRAFAYSVKDAVLRIPKELAYEVSGLSPSEAEERMNEYVNKMLTDLSETQFEAMVERLQKHQEIGEQSGRMTAMRETYGRQKA
jgi:hypothetical protein